MTPLSKTMNPQPFNIGFLLLQSIVQTHLGIATRIVKDKIEADAQAARARADQEWAQQQFDFLTPSR